MTRPYQRVLLTQEEYRKQERNKRWLKTACIAIPLILAVVSCAAGLYKAFVDVH